MPMALGVAGAADAVMGAQAVVCAAKQLGLDVCFANPGTTELPIVSALDNEAAIRPVLALAEGVAMGMADGYGRIAGKPALTLTHLGPCFASGLSSLHNARRAGTPVINLIGQFSAQHLARDPPLATDITRLAETASSWTKQSVAPDQLATDLQEAYEAAMGWPRGIATLILPEECQYADAPVPQLLPRVASRPRSQSSHALAQVAAVASDARHQLGLLLGGSATGESCLRLAQEIQIATGCRLFLEPFPARLEYGNGLPVVERLPYTSAATAALFRDVRHLILFGTERPVALFPRAGERSDLVPEAITVTRGAGRDEDVEGALQELLDRVRGAGHSPLVTARRPRVRPPNGALTRDRIAAAIAWTLPPDAILVDDGGSAAGTVLQYSSSCPRHTYIMSSTGGVLGSALPVASGAAMAAAHRPVIAIQGDGGAMYTCQALWTQARERLDVTNLILSNQSYALLNAELASRELACTGAARRLTSLADPPIDWVALATSLGVPATRVSDTAGLLEALGRHSPGSGPRLIDVRLSGP